MNLSELASFYFAIQQRRKIHYMCDFQLARLRSISNSQQRKQTIHRVKRQPMGWEKIFANDISNKELINKY